MALLEVSGLKKIYTTRFGGAQVQALSSVTFSVAEGKALVIEDTGIGISPEDLPRLGERGFTGYNGREDKKSTGLGLYLCKNICAKLGHKLIIESTPNVGTRVKLLFADSTMLYD